MHSFDVPSFDLWKVVFTAIGVAVFWAKWGRTRLKPFALSEITTLLIANKNVRMIVEFLVFLVLGCLVGIGMMDPQSAPQAITAGFGWTGAFAHPEKRT